MGAKVTVYTDHQALKFIITIKRSTEPLTERLGRWSLALEEYDLETIHGPGTKMVHVDALSRPPRLQLLDPEDGEEEKRTIKPIEDDGAILVEEDLDQDEDAEKTGASHTVNEVIVLQSYYKNELAAAHRADPYLGQLMSYIEGTVPPKSDANKIALEWRGPMHAINEEGILIRLQGFAK